MKKDGTAIVFCDKAFDTTYGKTAHGLVRFTDRYRVAAVIDSCLAGQDAGEFLDGIKSGIPLTADLHEAIHLAAENGTRATHFVVGLATDGGFLTDSIRRAALEALDAGLHVDSGLHEYISDIPAAGEKAEARGLLIRDIRRAGSGTMHAFTGKIKDVGSRRIAVLGTDSAIGKRTTAWLLVHTLRKAGLGAELIGTGQTAWMQGAAYGIILDALQNDYVSGELEHAVWSAWHATEAEILVIEGQGSLMNPGYPGGFEILAACRPDGVILQHAPARREYDGFPGYPLEPLADQIHAIEFISKKKVAAITINHEGLDKSEIDRVCKDLEEKTGLPTVDPLTHGMETLISRVPLLSGTNPR